MSSMCTEHDEPLKLYCKNDGALLCVICREGHSHEGHTFEPMIEAAEKVKIKVRMSLEALSSECEELEEMITKQTTELQKTQTRSSCLSTQISAQFEEMHQFLRKKEEEIKNLLEMEEMKSLKPMKEKQAAIETLLQRRKLEKETLERTLRIPEPILVMRWWNNEGIAITEDVGSPILDEDLDIVLVQDANVILDSFSLGPYESHLQFFVWKEMLSLIKPVTEGLTISSGSLVVSPDALSVRQADISCDEDYTRKQVYAEETFITGQHYWEVEVGENPDWSLAFGKVKERMNFLEKLLNWGDNVLKVQLQLLPYKGYILSFNDAEIPVLSDSKPRKIGLYLDCERNEVQFYNADDVRLIHKLTFDRQGPWLLCLCPGKNNYPLTVCCYRTRNK